MPSSSTSTAEVVADVAVANSTCSANTAPLSSAVAVTFS
jgi:hypothetical protein